MVNYIIQVILFQVLFLAVYDLFLSKETFFNKNRWYLLGTAIGSFLIPFIKIPSFQKVVPQEVSILLPEIMLSPQQVIENTAIYQSTSFNYVAFIFWLGCAVFFVLFFYKLEKIIRLILKHEIVKKATYKLVLLPKKSSAFSFFKFIFLGKEISEVQKEKIIAHELVHSSQNHSVDLLIFEFLKIIMWFNPMIWMYQHRVSLVHEYISDSIVAKKTVKENYINTLLSDLFQVENISFINQFYKHSLIKKRIIMMTKEKSNQFKQLRYLLLIPVLASMLFYTSCTDEVQTTDEVVVEKELSTMYFNKNGKIKETKGKKETYFDSYIGIGKEFRLPKGDEVTFNDLSVGEQDEYKTKMDLLNSFSIGKEKEVFFDLKIFKYNNNRKVLVFLPDFEKMKNTFKNPSVTSYEIEEVENVDEDVPFSIIETPPTFPGCSEGDKDCFNKKMKEFVKQNFDADLGKNLGLSSGKKKIYVQFKIDKDGSISSVNARAPHPSLKTEAIDMMGKLPRMKPGLQRGKKVKVAYTLPITFEVR